jgi:hypothetical protein
MKPVKKRSVVRGFFTVVYYMLLLSAFSIPPALESVAEKARAMLAGSKGSVSLARHEDND